jgi:hypothetical protein
MLHILEFFKGHLKSFKKTHLVPIELKIFLELRNLQPLDGIRFNYVQKFLYRMDHVGKGLRVNPKN